MKRWSLGALGGITIILGILYLAQPVGHIPPYDANFVRLAETEVQGYCSGKVLIQTGGTPDAKMTADCRSENSTKMSGKVNLRAVVPAFCQGVVDGGWDSTTSDCVAIMAQYEYWPTYDGTITNAWNRARPYPATYAALANGSQPNAGSRTGGHDGATRSGGGGHTGGYYGGYPGVP